MLFFQRMLLVGIAVGFLYSVFGSTHYDSIQEFWKAFAKKDFKKMEQLLDTTIDVNSTDLYGRTLLMEAAEQGHVNIMSELISHQLRFEKEMQLKAKDPLGETALFLAVKNGRVQAVQFILDLFDSPFLNAPSLNEQNAKGCTVLIEAAKAGHTEVIEILPKKSSIDIQDNQGMTALCWVAMCHDPKARANMKALCTLAKSEVPPLKINVNLRTKLGETALILAAKEKHFEAVKCLLSNFKKEIHVHFKDTQGMSGLMYCSQGGSLEAVQRLVDFFNADIHAKNKGEATSLQLAAGRDHSEIVAFLKQNGADVNGQDLNGQTALMRASLIGGYKTVKLLMELGADVKLIDKEKRTALMFAVTSTKLDVVQFLSKEKSMLNQKNIYGNTALIMAAWSGSLKMVKQLISLGADKNIKNNLEKTALDVAKELEKHAVVTFLSN